MLYIHYSHFHHIYRFLELTVRNSFASCCSSPNAVFFCCFKARIIDLQVCAWLKQDPIDSDRVSNWIETHYDVLQFDSTIIYVFSFR